MAHRVFLTGGSGYVGYLLVHTLAKRKDVERVIVLDKDPAPPDFAELEKVVFIQGNTSDEGWQSRVREHEPTVVIHAAWQIREMYGNQKTQWEWNIGGSENVFDFAFGASSVERLIHFSSASVYGAYATNTLEHAYLESEPLLEDEYLYGVEKRVSEEKLLERIQAHKGESRMKVFVVRPAAITGPRGKSLTTRFGLQSALSGTLRGSPVYSLVRALVSFVPGTKLWCRQFVHERDVVSIVEKLAFSDIESSYEAFNLAPPGAIVRVHDFAKAVGKRVIVLPPWLIRIAFFFFWHGTRGRIPTSRGGWKFYSYPIVMDGNKVTRMLDFTYTHSSLDAFKDK